MAAKIRSLQMWCKRQCEGYRDVEITNMTSSWKSGLAFCAIIHRYRPDLIDYDSLSKENVYENNKLAFDVGQEHLNIPALLDPEDMVAMTVPDKLCIVTYVSQYYNCFANMKPAGGPGIKQCRVPPKRASSSDPHSAAPEVKKTTPTRHLLADQNGLVKQGPDAAHDGQKVAAPTRKGTYGDTCHICGKKVYLMERHISDGQLYHRRCIRDRQKSTYSPTRPNHAPSAFHWPTNSKAASASHTEQEPTKTSTEVSSCQPIQLTSTAQITETRSRSTFQNTGNTAAIQSSNCLLSSSATNKQPAPSSLVKMLYGAATPYSSSNNSQNKERQSGDAVPMDTGLHKQNQQGNPDFGKPKDKPHSIMERAAMFNNTSDPKFGINGGEHKTVSSGLKRAPVPSSGIQNQHADSQSGKPKVNTVTYTYHKGVAPFSTKPEKSQPSSSNVRSGLLQSLANIRQQKGHEHDSRGTPAQVNAHGAKSELVEEKTSFLGHRSALTGNNFQINQDGMKSVQGHSATDGLNSQSADNKKSILKPSSPRQSFDGSSYKETVPKAILKPRPSDGTGMAGMEGTKKPILKPRRSPGETELELSSVGNPRPILKSTSPTETSQLIGSSPPKSILKSRETSPESDHKPSKSILKSKDNVEGMEACDEGVACESKPKSILKHLHDDSSHMRDDSIPSPIRSILKHAASRPDSRPILKSPHCSEVQKSASADVEVSVDKTVSSVPEEVNKRKTEMPIPSPRGRMITSESTSTPQPAPRRRINSHESSISTPQMPEQSREEMVTTSKTNQGSEIQQQDKIKTAPKSILKSSRDSTDRKDLASRAQLERSVPDASKSAGIPSLSSSIKNRPAGPTNNFSAFNLSDSLLIHGKHEATGGGSVDKPNSSPGQPEKKSTWQIEVEARTQVHQGKCRPPPRPAAPVVPASRLTSVLSADSNADSFDKKPSVNPMQAKRASVENMPDSSVAPSPSEGMNSGQRRSNGACTAPPRPPPPVTRNNQTISHAQKGIPVSQNTTRDKICPSPANYDMHGSPVNMKANLNRCPAFRIPDSPQSSPEPKRDEASGKSFGASCSGSEQPSVHSPSTAVGTSNKRKIVPDTRFSFQSGDFVDIGSGSPTLQSAPFNGNPESPLGAWKHSNSVSTTTEQPWGPPKRKVNAEARVATLNIDRDLKKLDEALQILEKEGRALEQKIRSVADDDMDEDNLMAEWFEMINKKNDLVRKESDLMYRKRQQELEDLHTDLEYELRVLMAKPENEKTASDRVRENALIQELLETVNQRNHIVDSMEEDRKRYIAEDQEIADMMAKTGITSSGGMKKKKNDKRKPPRKMNCRDRASLQTKIKAVDTHLDNGAAKDRKHFKLSVG